MDATTAYDELADDQISLDPDQEQWVARTGRRDFLKKTGLTLATAAGVMTSGGWVGARAAARSNVSLRYTLWDINQRPAMKKAIDVFTHANPNISVSIELYDWNHYWTKIQTEVAGGDAADLSWGHLAWWPGFIANGHYYLNEAPYIKRDKVDLGAYYAQLVDLYKINGQPTSLPKDWDTITVFYNKSLLQKAGLPDPSSGWTWNPTDGGDFLRYAQKLTLDHNGKNPTENGFDPKHIKQYGVISSDNLQELWINFVWMNGGDGVLKKPYSNVVTVDQPAAIAAFQFLHDLVHKYYVAPSPQLVNTIGDQPLFATNQVAMRCSGSWNLSSYTSTITKFNWGCALLPKGPAGRISAFNGLTHVIYAGTKHKEESWQLAKHMDSVATQTMVAKMGVVFPAVKASASDFVQAYAGKQPSGVANFISETTQTGLWPVHPKWTLINNELGKELDLFWLTPSAKASSAIPALGKALRAIIG